MTDFTRREFIQTGVTTGFALAVAPAAAWAVVVTSEDGITAESFALPMKGGKTMHGYMAYPKAKGPYPVVLVVHEIFGVHAYIQDVCRRLAHQGYLAIAPYLYFRQGDVTKMEKIDDIRAKVVSKVKQEETMQDLDETAKWAVDKKNGDPKRMGVIGFCWGGTAAWMYAAHNPSLKAAAAWYGRVVGDKTSLQSKFPLDIAPTLKVPVIGLYGALDKGIPTASLDKMKAVLKNGKSGSVIEVYTDAEHGFHADYRPSYHEGSAKDGWERMLTFFKKNGLK